MDAKKMQKQKEKQEMRMRKQLLQPPADPDSIPDISWFAPDRKRPKPAHSDEIIETRALLCKEWCRYQMKKHIDDLQVIRDKIELRNKALRELQKESQFLYEEAMKVDKTMFPLTLLGPMETPPMEGYQPPDFVD